jgi:hypothetical protein
MYVLFIYLQWFEEKQQQIENLDQQLRKLHGNMENLVQHRRGQYACSITTQAEI